jgi:tetratricopeptide (TPR) repeat protein
VVVVILWQGPPIYKRVTGHTISWEALAVLLALAGFGTLMVRSRRRTVFQDFSDCTTPGTSGVVPGLGGYLANEVDRLGALYRTVRREYQEKKGPEAPGDPIKPTIELDDTAEFLKGAVSPDAKLSFGPVSIPVGSILGLVARLMKGPQITGSLHREDDQLILLAHYEGAHPKSWRVQGEQGSAETDDKGRWNLYPLVMEMATRMLGDLTLGGTVKFRAVRAFTKAMRASLEDGGLERPSLLRQLEVKNNLLEAIAEDDSFDLAWYNLGVTLFALDDEEMARSVFARARRDASRWQASYALAVLPGDVTTRMLLCEQMLGVGLEPGPEAQAYDLEGNLFAEQARSPGGDDATDLRKLAVARRRRAARLAWRALRQAEWSARNDQESVQLKGRKRLAATCLTNLAHSYRDDIIPKAGNDPKQLRRPARQAELLLKEAGKLARLDPHAHWELGELNDRLGNSKRAAREYAKVLRVVIDNPDAWVSFARASASVAVPASAPASAKVKRTQGLASHAARVLLTLAPLVQQDQLTDVAKAIEGFDSTQAGQLRQLAALHHQVDEAIRSASQRKPGARLQLESLAEEAESLPGAVWEHFRCVMALCRQEPPRSAMSPIPKTLTELLDVTQKLEKECAPALRQENFHYTVAAALAGWGLAPTALEHAEKATQANPFNSWTWQLLGDLHRRRAEFDEAEKCYLYGLRWVAECVQLVALTVSLAACRLDQLEDQSAAQPANKGLLNAQDRLVQVLPALKSSDLCHRIKVHYWLGRVALALGDSQQAIAHFAAAAQPNGPSGQLSCNDVSIVTLSRKAQALMLTGRLDEARTDFDSVVAAITEFGSDESRLAATVNMRLDVPPTLAVAVDAVQLDETPAAFASVPAAITEFGSDESGLATTANVGLDRSPTLCEVLVDAILSSADTLATRGADPTEAKRRIERALRQLPRLPEEARNSRTGRSEALLGRIAAMAGNDDQAIEHLRRSISFVSDAGTYLSLAEAYGRAARQTRAPARQREFRRLLEDCGRNVRTIYAGDNHIKGFDELTARIDAITAGLPEVGAPGDRRPGRKSTSAHAPAPPAAPTT